MTKSHFNNSYNKSKNYRDMRREQREDAENKKLNIAMAAMAKLGFEEEYQKQWNDFEVMEPREVEPRYKVRSAPTTNPSRPRALKIAYSHEAQKLVIRFRGNKGAENNGPWIGYDDVPVEIWNGLKSSDSTGKYLKYSGVDAMPWSHFDPSQMPEDVRVLFNS